MNRVAILFVLILITVAGWSQETFKSLSDKGNKAIDVEDYSAALTYFDKALQLGSEDEESVAWMAGMAAVCAQQLNDGDKVLKYQQVAIQNNSTDQYLYEAQIKLATKMKNNEVLEETLLKGRTNIEGSYSKYTNKLVYFYFNNQKFEQVVRAADEYLAVKPGSARAIYMKSTALSAMGKYKEAIPGFLGVLSAKPKDMNANMQLGLVYYKQGSKIYDDAKEWYNSKKEPSRLDYSEYRKKMLKCYDPYKKSLPYLTKVFDQKKDETSRKALYTIYSRMDNPGEAEKYK